MSVLIITIIKMMVFHKCPKRKFFWQKLKRKRKKNDSTLHFHSELIWRKKQQKNEKEFYIMEKYTSI